MRVPLELLSTPPPQPCSVDRGRDASPSPEPRTAADPHYFSGWVAYIAVTLVIAISAVAGSVLAR
jgi:hypothetical protein